MTEPRLAELFTSLRALRDAQIVHAGQMAETALALQRVAEQLAALSATLNARDSRIDGRIAAAAGRIRAIAQRVDGHAFELGVGLEALSRVAHGAEHDALEDTCPLGLPVDDGG